MTGPDRDYVYVQDAMSDMEREVHWYPMTVGIRNGAMVDMLSQSGLPKYFQIPLTRSGKLFPNKMVIFWYSDVELFII